MNCVACSLSGLHLATAHHNDHSVRVWSSETLTQLHKMAGHTGRVDSVAWSPDSARIVSGSADRTMRVWDVPTGCEVGKMEGHESIVRSVAYSPDGLRIASGSLDCTVRLWDATTFQELRIIKLGSVYSMHGANRVHAVAFSSHCEPTKLVSGSHDTIVRVWDTASGKGLRKLTGHTGLVTSVAFSQCGTRIASGSYDRSVRVWDADTGKLLRTLKSSFRKAHTFVSAVAFSPGEGGAQIVSSIDDQVLAWDVKSGHCCLTLEGHRAQVSSVAFSPDGSHIFSVSGDFTIRKWDARTGQPVLVVNFLDIDIPFIAEDIRRGAMTSSDLSIFRLQDHHLFAIAEALMAPSCALKRLNLGGTGISPVAAVTLATALKVNTSLEEVDVSFNPTIGDVGGAALVEAIKINYAITEFRFYGGSASIQAQIGAALRANKNPVRRQVKKVAYEERLQREMRPTKVGKWLA